MSLRFGVERLQALAAIAIWLGCGLAGSPALSASEALVGSRPQTWQVDHWINSEPLELGDLQGNVVLVRWWTGPHCPLCRASAAALNEFHQRFEDEGLIVIGLYHHKEASPLYVERIGEYARSLGFEFPVAIDEEWKTLEAWWLDKQPRGFTSVSFLLGRDGSIRYVHPGGKYVRGDGQFEKLESEIVRSLREPQEPSANG